MAESQNSTGLIKYDAACLAIASAKSVDEVKQIRNAGAALSAYAKIAKNKQLEADAAEIRIRAERRVGQMMAEQKASVGLAKGGEPLKKRHSTGAKFAPVETTSAPTLESAGIDKHLAKTARKLAALPEQKFETLVSDWRDKVDQGVARVTVDLLQEKAHVSHNSGENEWYTPAYILDAAREVMGGFDCDPASSSKANLLVRATRYYTEQTDGLRQKEWGARVWMNPPYAQPLIGQLIDALAGRVEDGRVKQACVLVNNATDTAWAQTLFGLAAAVCFFRGRVRFLDPDGKPSGAPLQGQMLVYIGPLRDVFGNRCAEMGSVWYARG
jgi:ParB family chromosome partitioning protein